MVNPLKVNVPLLAIDDDVLDIVIVPVGVKVVELFKVSTPATEKFTDGWVVGVPAIVNPLKVVAVPTEAIVHPVPVIVIVPPDGAKVWLALTVKAPAIE